jgi:WD40 repeat protein
MFVWQAHEGAVTSLAFGPGGRFLASAGADAQVKVWDPLTGAEQLSVSLHPFDVGLPGPAVGSRAPRCLCVSGDGGLAAVAQFGRGLVFLDLDRGEEVAVLPADGVTAVKAAPDGQSLFALHRESARGSWVLRQYAFADRDQLESLGLLYWHTPRGFGVSPDGTRVAAGHTVYEWPHWKRNAYTRGLHMKGYVPDDLAFSADMQHLFALVGGKVAVYSLETTLFKTKLKGHNGRITAMALAPDGRRLWTASHDATVKCWDTFSLALDRTFTFATGGLDCLAVSPDGNVAAVGSGQKGTITLWDLG